VIRRIRASIARADYGALAVELAIVVVGILIAFQVDRWAEDWQQQNLEREYVLRLSDDIESEVAIMRQSIDIAQSRIDAVFMIETVIADPDDNRDKINQMPVAIEKASWFSYPRINAFIYTELRNSGNLSVMRSVDLRRSLADYYSTMNRYSLVGHDRTLHHEYTRLTAGILTSAELQFIEEDQWTFAGTGVPDERAQEIVEAFMQRHEAIALLPGLAQQNIFNRKVTENSLRQGEALIATIQSELGGQ
jgi:hypothetical protein